MIPMRKLMDKIKKNNKGFTLVELIVVIAVLAIITVVAAPQYLQYVDKSKEGTDENALGEIAHIAEIQWVELEAAKEGDDEVDDDVVVTVSAGNFVVAGDEALDESVSTIVGTYKVKSEKYSAEDTSITIKIVNGVAQWPYTASEDGE